MCSYSVPDIPFPTSGPNNNEQGDLKALLVFLSLCMDKGRKIRVEKGSEVDIACV